MKKFRLQSASFIGAILLFFFLPTSGLKAVSAPHAGVYECKKMSLDGVELPPSLHPSLCLKEDGTGALYFKDAQGNSHTQMLSYEKEEGKDELVFLYQFGDKQLKIPSSYSQGEIVFTRQLGTRLLVLVFARK